MKAAEDSKEAAEDLAAEAAWEAREAVSVVEDPDMVKNKGLKTLVKGDR